jgi:hypothetical protein
LKGFDDVPRNWFWKKHGQDSKWEHFARVHHHANEGTRYTTYFVRQIERLLFSMSDRKNEVAVQGIKFTTYFGDVAQNVCFLN